MNLPYPLILASASPRRREFMQALNLPFDIHPADIDETPFPGESPPELVRRLSREKAEAVAPGHPHALIIAADTLVVLKDQILGKPDTPAHARAMLTQLRGQDHHVYSALSLLQPRSGQHFTALSDTVVTMRRYTNAELEAYIASGDPLDKAGGYAIQHPGFAPVAGLSGCYAGVIGFPLKQLAEGLPKFGVNLPRAAGQCAAFTGHACCLPFLDIL